MHIFLYYRILLLILEYYIISVLKSMFYILKQTDINMLFSYNHNEFFSL